MAEIVCQQECKYPERVTFKLEASSLGRQNLDADSNEVCVNRNRCVVIGTLMTSDKP